jgi:hypothetical protein
LARRHSTESRLQLVKAIDVTCTRRCPAATRYRRQVNEHARGQQGAAGWQGPELMFQKYEDLDFFGILLLHRRRND